MPDPVWPGQQISAPQPAWPGTATNRGAFSVPQLDNFRRANPAYADPAQWSDVDLLSQIYLNVFADRMSQQEFWDRITPPEGGWIPNSAGGAPEMSPLDMLFQTEAAAVQREQQQAERAGRPFVQKAGDYIRAFAQGLTRGNWDEVAGLIARLPRPGGSDFTADERQRMATDYEREQGATFAAEHPTQNFLAESVGATLPYGIFGQQIGQISQLPMVQQAPIWGGIGGAEAFAYGAGTADTPDIASRLMAGREMAPYGAAIGYAAPVVAAGVGPALQTAGRTAGQVAGAFNPARRAGAMVDEALAGAGTTRQDVAAAMSRNPDLMPMDVEPSLFRLGQGLAAQPGRAQTTITQALDDRMGNMPSITREIFSGTLGDAPDAAALLNTMRQNARNVGQYFDPVLDQAGPINIQPVLHEIDSRLPQGWRYSRTLTPQQIELVSLRNQLAGSGNEQLVDAQALHGIQSELRVSIDDLLSGASGGDVRIARVLKPVRDSIVDALDLATGGQYRPLQQAYADEMAVQRAFERGHQILDNPRSGPASVYARPEFWQEWYNGLSLAEQEAARLGALTRLDTELGSARSAVRQGINIPQVDFNRERLSILFGQDEIDELLRRTQDQRTMLSNTQGLLGGSQTAQRREAAEAVAPRTAGASGLGLGGAGLFGMGLSQFVPEATLPSMALMAAAGLRRAGSAIGGALDRSRNASMAEALSARGPGAAASFAAGPQSGYQATSLPDIIAPFITSRAGPALDWQNVPEGGLPTQQQLLIQMLMGR